MLGPRRGRAVALPVFQPGPFLAGGHLGVRGVQAPEPELLADLGILRAFPFDIPGCGDVQIDDAWIEVIYQFFAPEEE